MAEPQQSPSKADDAESAAAREGSPTLETELAAARKRVDELARAYQALERDREEFKQRLARERERLIDVEKGQVAQALIEAVDQLDLCLASAETSPLAKGVKLIRENLVRSLERTGVTRLDLIGHPFDPNLAEAADTELTSEPADDQRVLEVLRAGYELKGRVVRPARVKVARYVKPAQA